MCSLYSYSLLLLKYFDINNSAMGVIIGSLNGLVDEQVNKTRHPIGIFSHVEYLLVNFSPGLNFVIVHNT